jgi:hypothetical protein
LRLLPRRALVAIGLALSFVVSAAAPAQASPVYYFNSPGTVTSGNGYGSATAYYDSGFGLGLTEDVAATKTATGTDYSDEYTCTETFVDWRLSMHRPSDVFTNCRVGTFDSGNLPIHWAPSQGGNFTVQVSQDYVTASAFHVTVCKTDVRPTAGNFDRGANCQNGSTGAVGSISHADYEHLSLQGIDTAWGCGNSSCWPAGADLQPEYRNRGNIDLMGVSAADAGSLLVSWDGSHRFVMQHDGNLVLYKANNTASWAMSNCLAAGESLSAGSHLNVQGDGNIVVYNAGWTHAIWASVNHNGCGSGSSGSSGQYLKMQNDGNLVEYSAAGALWTTGTNGQ